MNNKVLLILISLFASSCLAQDTTNPQVSLNINESKKKGFFVKEYYLKERPFEDFVVEEAWVEKGSYNNKKGIQIVREAEDWCQLCFKLKQIPSSKFLLQNVFDWSMRESQGKGGVGVHIESQIIGPPIGIYIYSMFYANRCLVPDSMSFDLYVGSKRNKNEKYIGRFVLYAK